MLQLLSKTIPLSARAERILFNISFFITVFVIILLVIMGLWAVQPSRILTIYNEPIPVVSDGAKAGTPTIFQIKYCKTVGLVGQVNWYIVGNNAVTLLPSYRDYTKTSCGTVLDPVIIPKQLVPGTYYIVWQVTYPINPLKSDYTEFRSRDFDVVK